MILAKLIVHSIILASSNQARINVISQGHNVVTLVRLKPTAPWSRVPKRSRFRHLFGITVTNRTDYAI